MTSRLRLSTVAVATTAAVLSAGGASLAAASPGAHAASHQIKSGKTSIALNSDSLNALIKDKFSLAPTGRAKVSKSFALVFPVTGGTFSNAGKGTIKHTGGIKISKKTKSVTIKNLVVKLHSGKGSAVVTGHGRMPAITVASPQGGGPHSVTGYTVSLSKPLIKVLDKKFHTKAFKKHATLGTGSTNLKLKK